jgi:mono/diheme cytochrome c family protein
MTRWVLPLTAALVVFGTGCARPDSPHGFRLPEGNAAAGRVVFADFGCGDCHRVEGEAFAAPHAAALPIVLGGQVALVPTAGQLTTDITCPSARLTGRYPREVVAVGSRSKMPEFARRMTVQQVADLVAFLQPRYERATAPMPF